MPVIPLKSVMRPLPEIRFGRCGKVQLIITDLEGRFVEPAETGLDLIILYHVTDNDILIAALKLIKMRSFTTQ